MKRAWRFMIQSVCAPVVVNAPRRFSQVVVNGARKFRQVLGSPFGFEILHFAVCIMDLWDWMYGAHPVLRTALSGVVFFAFLRRHNTIVHHEVRRGVDVGIQLALDHEGGAETTEEAEAEADTLAGTQEAEEQELGEDQAEEQKPESRFFLPFVRACVVLLARLLPLTCRGHIHVLALLDTIFFLICFLSIFESGATAWNFQE